MTAPRRERADDAHMALQAVAWYTLDFTCLGLLEWGSCLTGRSQTATSSAGQVALGVGRAMGPSGLAEKLLQAPWVWALAGGGGLRRIIPHLHPNGLH